MIKSDELEEAVHIIKEGGVIVYPTETSYGLGCDATNAEAVDRIFNIKGRDKGEALPIILPDLGTAAEYVSLSEKALKLAATHWPGPLNIIAPCIAESPAAPVCAKNGTQSVRVSSHSIAADLTRRLGKPLVATSANKSGEESLYSAEEVEKAFANEDEKPDLIVDAGELPKNLASTTEYIDGDEVSVLRHGDIQIEN